MSLAVYNTLIYSSNQGQGQGLKRREKEKLGKPEGIIGVKVRF